MFWSLRPRIFLLFHTVTLKQRETFLKHQAVFELPAISWAENFMATIPLPEKGNRPCKPCRLTVSSRFSLFVEQSLRSGLAVMVLVLASASTLDLLVVMDTFGCSTGKL